MKMFESDVACLVPNVPLPLADKCYTLCDVGSDGGLDFDGLGMNCHQHQCLCCVRAGWHIPLWRR